MAALSTALRISGHRRAFDPLGIPGAQRIALPDGVGWAFAAPATLSVPGALAPQSWHIAAGVCAILWETRLDATPQRALDLHAHAYMIFAQPLDGALYAVPQEAWLPVVTENDLAPICWVDAHHDLVPRLRSAPSCIAVVVSYAGPTIIIGEGSL